MGGRNDTIDTFRGVAILMVMAYHFLVRWAPPNHSVDLFGFDHVYSQGFQLGCLGVHLFFVISGLVITMAAVRAAGAFDFAVRRFARLYPAFLVCCTATFLILANYDPVGLRVGWVDYLANLTMLSRDLGFPYVDGAYWSLVVEIHFYAIVGASLLILRHRFWMGVLAVLVAGAVIGRFVPLVGKALIADYSAFFLVGVAAWYGLMERARGPALALGLGALICFAATPATLTQWPALLPAAALLALLAAGINWKGFGLVWVGRISYPLYLIHGNLGLLVIHELTRRGASDWLAIEAAVLASVLAAALVHYWIDRPGNRVILYLWRGMSRHPGPRPNHLRADARTHISRSPEGIRPQAPRIMRASGSRIERGG